MKQRLALSRSTLKLADRAIFLDLSNVAAHGDPALDLTLIIEVAAAIIIATIPLEPTSGVVRVNPAF